MAGSGWKTDSLAQADSMSTHNIALASNRKPRSDAPIIPLPLHPCSQTPGNQPSNAVENDGHGIGLNEHLAGMVTSFVAKCQTLPKTPYRSFAVSRASKHTTRLVAWLERLDSLPGRSYLPRVSLALNTKSAKLLKSIYFLFNGKPARRAAMR